MTTQEFIKKMVDDEALSKKMSECKTPEEAYAAAKEAGVSDDIENFKAVIASLNKQLSQMNGELSDDELENVAGGFGECVAIEPELCIYVSASRYFNITKPFLASM